jgi:hypothetical protein
MELVMNYKKNFEDVERIAIKICLEISTDFSQDEKLNLVLEDAHIESLLNSVKKVQKTETLKLDDNTLRFFLNLTDFSPKICKSFVVQGGIDLFLSVGNVSNK